MKVYSNFRRTDAVRVRSGSNIVIEFGTVDVRWFWSKKKRTVRICKEFLYWRFVDSGRYVPEAVERLAYYEHLNSVGAVR